MKSFSSLHPVTLFVYFVTVLFIAMFQTNPILLLLSFIGSVCFFTVHTKKQRWKELGGNLLLFILIALINPIFIHNGKTILFFLGDNPVTWEAVFYGIIMAVMLMAVLYWCRSLTKMMTSDKVMYLFGRTIPKLSVIFSMALRFIPLFKIQITKINKAQTAMGLYANNTYIDNAKGSLRVFSIMVTWSLENAIDTADSMRARGYGLKGRTQYSIYRFTVQDGVVLTLSLFLFCVTLLGIGFHAVDFDFYPELTKLTLTIPAFVTYVAYGLLSLLPFIIEVKEHLKWIFYKSKI